MANFLKHSKIHVTFHQAKKIHRHKSKLKQRGVEKCHVVSGYPKSGNTWLARMLSDAIGCELVSYLTDFRERLLRESNNIPDEILRNVVVTKSHHTASLLKLGGINLRDTVFVVRDPRDIAVSGSGFLFASDNVPSEERIDKMIDQMVETQKPGVRWEDLRWDCFQQSAIEKKVLMVRYVDLLNDPVGSLGRILTHLRCERSNDRIEHVVSFHNFATSKTRAEASGRKDIHQFFRQGEAGAFQSYLTPRQRQRIESEFGYMMKHLGYL